MIAVYVIQPGPYHQVTLIDAGIISLLIFPVLYFLSFRPLLQHIEKRRQAEEALIQARELQERFFDSIDTLIAYMDHDFNFIRVNEAYANAGGYPSDYFIGRNHFALYPDAENLKIFQRVVQTGEAFSVYEKTFEYPDQPERGVTYWNWSLLPVRDRDGEVEGLVLSLIDVTERRRGKEQLERQNEELRTLSAAEHEQRQLAETLRVSALALTQSLDLDEVIHTLLKHIRSLVRADTASIFFREGGSIWSVRAVDGFETGANPQKMLSIALDGKSSALVQRLTAAQESVLIPDTRAEADWVIFPGMESIRNYVGVPMFSEDQMMGFVGLGKTMPGHFTEAHIQWAEALVGHAAIAIQNAWLFEQVRAGRERLQFLSRRLVEVQESERRYIARELHDQAGQSLSSLLLGLGQLERDCSRPADTREHIKKLKVLTNDTLEELHRLAVNLRPASLDHLGLVPALDQLIKSFVGESNLQVHFKGVGFDENDRLPADVETTLYRIVQEALTNTLRHSKASHADVILERREDSILMIVEDNGIGFNTELPRPDRQMGLLGIQERAEMLGGNLTIESVQNRGTTLVVEVPNVNSGFISR